MDITDFLEARITEDEAEASVAKAEFAHGGYGCYGPARVLAECAAKRAIIAGIIPERDPQAGNPDYDPLWVIRELAAVYKDHPDYRKEWAIGG